MPYEESTSTQVQETCTRCLYLSQLYLEADKEQRAYIRVRDSGNEKTIRSQAILRNMFVDTTNLIELIERRQCRCVRQLSLV